MIPVRALAHTFNHLYIYLYSFYLVLIYMRFGRRMPSHFRTHPLSLAYFPLILWLEQKLHELLPLAEMLSLSLSFPISFSQLLLLSSFHFAYFTFTAQVWAKSFLLVFLPMSWGSCKIVSRFVCVVAFFFAVVVLNRILCARALLGLHPMWSWQCGRSRI